MLNNATIKALIDKLWNSFWSGGISNPLTAIEQITYLIFMKRLDEMKSNTSIFRGKYKIPGTDEVIEKSKLRWSNFKDFSPEVLLTHVQTKVFPFLKDLNGGDNFSKSMSNAVFIMPKPSLLKDAISTIEAIFVEIKRDATEGGQSFQDIQGDVYEMLLSEIASAGKNGQFRTPRHIIKLIADLVQPQLNQKIADPACGTGGFLLGAYQYILTQLVLKDNPDNVWHDEDGFLRATISSILEDDLKNLVDNNLVGYDIDTTMVRLGLMNLMMHGIEQPNIKYTDALSKSYNEEDQYDLILANPPFTGNIDKEDINKHLSLPTTKTELLFIERIYTMLKDGGIAAIVVPQGVLFGSGKAFIEARKIMIEQSSLKAVITLPSGVFKPYAGVSTAILIFKKGSETEDVWFYEMESDGYSLDDKRSKQEKSDLQDIVLQYHSRMEIENNRKAKFFFVSKKEIVDNKYDLSLNKYKEEIYTEITYDKPNIIFERLQDIELRISNGLKELKELI